MILLAAGMIPAFFLMYKIYKLDKIEPEPRNLLIKLFLAGGVSIFAAMIIETIGMMILGFVVPNQASLLYMLVENFIVVGIAEEGVKYFALKKISWYHPAFNFRFDGVVYSAAVALGFAAFENVMYIVNFGYGVAPVRALTAIPMHCICGIYMGHFYGETKKCEADYNWPGMDSAKRKALYVPVLLHGFYDFAASSENGLISLLFIVFVIILDIYSIRAIRNYAAEDVPV